MGRSPRLERAGAFYHVINRGNYRRPIFASAGAKHAFLRCLHEACLKTGWVVHAWCILDNHYHLALETPRANLVRGMQWLQGTFARRFNGWRREQGHLFQGRYRSLLVDPDEGLGPVCHYIHLNPFRAGLCNPQAVPRYRWASLRWLMDPGLRPSWYTATAPLLHAGGLADREQDRIRYQDYLQWLAEDEPAQKRQRFDRMARGWAFGSMAFEAATVSAVTASRGHRQPVPRDMAAAQESCWNQTLAKLLHESGHTQADLATAGKSTNWKLAIGAALKAQTTATNRWLATELHLGNLHEVSRKLSAWRRKHGTPTTHLSTPSPKA